MRTMLTERKDDGEIPTSLVDNHAIIPVGKENCSHSNNKLHITVGPTLIDMVFFSCFALLRLFFSAVGFDSLVQYK